VPELAEGAAPELYDGAVPELAEGVAPELDVDCVAGWVVALEAASPAIITPTPTNPTTEATPTTLVAIPIVSIARSRRPNSWFLRDESFAPRLMVTALLSYLVELPPVRGG
jgi:hypothetical protein